MRDKNVSTLLFRFFFSRYPSLHQRVAPEDGSFFSLKRNFAAPSSFHLRLPSLSRLPLRLSHSCRVPLFSSSFFFCKRTKEPRHVLNERATCCLERRRRQREPGGNVRVAGFQATVKRASEVKESAPEGRQGKSDEEQLLGTASGKLFLFCFRYRLEEPRSRALPQLPLLLRRRGY